MGRRVTPGLVPRHRMRRDSRDKRDNLPFVEPAGILLKLRCNLYIIGLVASRNVSAKCIWEIPVGIVEVPPWDGTSNVLEDFCEA